MHRECAVVGLSYLCQCAEGRSAVVAVLTEASGSVDAAGIRDDLVTAMKGVCLVGGVETRAALLHLLAAIKDVVMSPDGVVDDGAAREAGSSQLSVPPMALAIIRGFIGKLSVKGARRSWDGNRSIIKESATTCHAAHVWLTVLSWVHELPAFHSYSSAWAILDKLRTEQRLDSLKELDLQGEEGYQSIGWVVTGVLRAAVYGDTAILVTQLGGSSPASASLLSQDDAAHASGDVPSQGGGEDQSGGVAPAAADADVCARVATWQSAVTRADNPCLEHVLLSVSATLAHVQQGERCLPTPCIVAGTARESGHPWLSWQVLHAWMHCGHGTRCVTDDEALAAVKACASTVASSFPRKHDDLLHWAEWCCTTHPKLLPLLRTVPQLCVAESMPSSDYVSTAVKHGIPFKLKEGLKSKSQYGSPRDMEVGEWVARYAASPPGHAVVRAFCVCMCVPLCVSTASHVWGHSLLPHRTCHRIRRASSHVCHSCVRVWRSRRYVCLHRLRNHGTPEPASLQAMESFPRFQRSCPR